MKILSAIAAAGRWPRLLPALLALFCGGAVSANTGVEGADLRISALNAKGGSLLQVEVSGNWRNGCVPQLVDVEQHGDIVLLARESRAEGGCIDADPGYRFDTATLAPALRVPRGNVGRIRYEIEHLDGRRRLHGFALVDASPAGSSKMVPETGMWWPEKGALHGNAGPGVGATLEAQGEDVSVVVFGYSASGTPEWYLASGPRDGRVAQLPLSHLSDGGGPIGSYRAPQQIASAGFLDIELHSPARATFWFRSPDPDGTGAQVLKPVSMVRFSFSQSPAKSWLGRWVLLGDGGSFGEVEPRRLTLTMVEDTAGADAVVLTNEDGSLRLECRVPSGSVESLPQHCVLFDAATAEEVDFREVSLSRMRGWSNAGHALLMIRLD